MKKKDITYWNVPVDKPLNEALEEAIRRDWHRTKAEFIRELVRQELKRMGYRPPSVPQEVEVE
jgi:Arc/MetJ-type ribon-helix-helix transcriptional regulator